MHFIRGKNSDKLKNSQAEAIDIYLHLFHSTHNRKNNVSIYLKYNMHIREIRVWFEAERYRFSLRAISLLHALSSICVAYCKFHRRSNLHKARSIKHSSIVASRIVIFLPRISIIWKKKRKKRSVKMHNTWHGHIATHKPRCFLILFYII